jgi:hypothetical protein
MCPGWTLEKLVDVTGIEPATSCLQIQKANSDAVKSDASDTALGHLESRGVTSGTVLLGAGESIGGERQQ